MKSPHGDTEMSFPLFKQLPTELRLVIWKMAQQDCAPAREVCVFQRAKPRWNGTKPKPTLRKPLMVDQTYSPLMATCKEARTIALASLGPRPFDPEVDILYVGGEVEIYFSCMVSYRPGEAPTCSLCQIRHLAMDVRTSYFHVLIFMSRIKTLSLVFSQTVYGRPLEDPPWPGKKGVDDGPTKLRMLSRSETDAMIIRAIDVNGWSSIYNPNDDWIKVSSAGEDWADWNKSATEGMERIRYDIERKLYSELWCGFQHLPLQLHQIPDFMMTLEIKARCFV